MRRDVFFGFVAGVFAADNTRVTFSMPESVLNEMNLATLPTLTTNVWDKRLKLVGCAVEDASTYVTLDNASCQTFVIPGDLVLCGDLKVEKHLSVATALDVQNSAMIEPQCIYRPPTDGSPLNRSLHVRGASLLVNGNISVGRSIYVDQDAAIDLRSIVAAGLLYAEPSCTPTSIQRGTVTVRGQLGVDNGATLASWADISGGTILVDDVSQVLCGCGGLFVTDEEEGGLVVTDGSVVNVTGTVVSSIPSIYAQKSAQLEFVGSVDVMRTVGLYDASSMLVYSSLMTAATVLKASSDLMVSGVYTSLRQTEVTLGSTLAVGENLQAAALLAADGSIVKTEGIVQVVHLLQVDGGSLLEITDGSLLCGGSILVHNSSALHSIGTIYARGDVVSSGSELSTQHHIQTAGRVAVGMSSKVSVGGSINTGLDLEPDQNAMRRRRRLRELVETGYFTDDPSVQSGFDGEPDSESDEPLDLQDLLNEVHGPPSLVHDHALSGDGRRILSSDGTELERTTELSAMSKRRQASRRGRRLSSPGKMLEDDIDGAIPTTIANQQTAKKNQNPHGAESEAERAAMLLQAIWSDHAPDATANPHDNHVHDVDSDLIEHVAPRSHHGQGGLRGAAKPAQGDPPASSDSPLSGPPQTGTPHAANARRMQATLSVSTTTTKAVAKVTAAQMGKTSQTTLPAEETPQQRLARLQKEAQQQIPMTAAEASMEFFSSASDETLLKYANLYSGFNADSSSSRMSGKDGESLNAEDWTAKISDNKGLLVSGNSELYVGANVTSRDIIAVYGRSTLLVGQALGIFDGRVLVTGRSLMQVSGIIEVVGEEFARVDVVGESVLMTASTLGASQLVVGERSRVGVGGDLQLRAAVRIYERGVCVVHGPAVVAGSACYVRGGSKMMAAELFVEQGSIFSDDLSEVTTTKGDIVAHGTVAAQDGAKIKSARDIVAVDSQVVAENGASIVAQGTVSGTTAMTASIAVLRTSCSEVRGVSGGIVGKEQIQHHVLTLEALMIESQSLALKVSSTTTKAAAPSSSSSSIASTISAGSNPLQLSGLASLLKQTGGG